jgi:hypothetical protein
VQLGIWSASLSERLRKLQGQQGENESELMAIPVVTIVGHDWKVYYNYTAENGERVSFECTRADHGSAMLIANVGATIWLQIVVERDFRSRLVILIWH